MKWKLSEIYLGSSYDLHKGLVYIKRDAKNRLKLFQMPHPETTELKTIYIPVSYK